MSNQNKALVRRGVEEVWNGQNFDAAYDIVASDFVVHASRPGNETYGAEGAKQFYVALHQAFPDVEFKIEDHVAEGDRVVTRWSARGTHKGEFQGIPPTGTQVSLHGIDIDRIVNGKIVECWMNFDELGLLQQLGVIEAPEPPA